MHDLLQAVQLVAAPDVLIAILASAIYGLVVGSLPGLSATMATALLVPVTFWLSPIAAIATIITASAMAIFSGDIPGCLLRIPGTPASAAYTDEAYAMTRKGQAEMALGAGLWFSAIGGIVGTLSLVLMAPLLAEMALSFSTYEYFWLALLGLMCATLVARSSPIKAIAAMLLGLLIACIGMENPAGTPRFTFGLTDLLGGIEPIPALVGVFAVSEVMRAMLTPEPPPLPKRKFGSILANQWMLTKKYQWPMWRGNIIGIIIGVLPGAGADMAAWVSYAMSKKFSKTPELFGTGHPEGLVEAGASNNASLASGWVPSLLFGIPGDTITAIAIGVLYMKGLNPGPTLFTERASSMYALYLIFILANIIMIPLGIIMIRLASTVLRAPRAAVMPVILVLCAVGAFATGNNLFSVLLVGIFGCLGFVMERNGYPVAALVLGIVMGNMVEQNFITSLIKSDGDVLPFFERPVSGVLAALTFGALLWPLGVWVWNRVQGRAARAA
ncbi:tripartite tricarboxylate transporter permease [Paracraurococcus ruber]|uniref:C4-dicarboxylate ABC transporter permease n=1 Tax=Paracraurococcus ruber TaxID=77675 RepID=A0ABS1D1H6_9PROT|nr:tripartite tricarboxylate transporter permease [Paracraurococcus ruber]MBK1660363.1 C4-dicarboxylate ABC transporter permease [Paracraurococcus ruber]TDG31856.1 C4-dicarboxylate ABC transporter permease [Paracraurococcus ruber]